jgi:uncharacterized cupin superfamily protein
MTKPAVPATSLPATRGSSYPAPFAARVGNRTRYRLGEAFDLTQFGANLTILHPGDQSALRHWHTHEDELIYILEGELVLRTDAGDQIVRAGDVVGFPGGVENGHQLVNRSTAPARYLEIGTRIEDDLGRYPDDDLALVLVDGEALPVHKDGRPY